MQAKTATEKFMAPSQDQRKHTLPFIFMLIGGLLILLGGVYEGSLIHSVSANAIISNLSVSNPSIAHNATDLKLIKNYVNSGTYETLYIVVVAVGIICGIMVMLSGIMSYNPKGNRLKMFSIVAIIFSLISIFGSAGFIVGMILGIIGGVLGLMKK
jgi:formate/nitrite transporter FocA (FNT family)